MKIKNNEPCPCGSGKSFKSFCKRKLSEIKEVKFIIIGLYYSVIHIFNLIKIRPGRKYEYFS